MSKEPSKHDEFDDLANSPRPSLLQEFAVFVVDNRAWWMIPILVVFALVGILLLLTSTGAAPFIYTLF
jgi:hypothetical protein